ncbi:dockerin type I repeat-containing protein [Sanyastnella coralliicola]|uniref:dockerin type I repeat-containing protein n=1 Tax=Sanyastnella coralliicola TaxID=3069118 RepID=UPI0027BA0B66|nr:dockerin type I repeat-containing protein [Longitalea sp. SCSIO 12813]
MPSYLKLVLLLLLVGTASFIQAQEDCDGWNFQLFYGFPDCNTGNLEVNLNIVGTDDDDDAWTVWFSYGYGYQPILWYVVAEPGDNYFNLSGFEDYPFESELLIVEVATSPSPNYPFGHCVEEEQYSLSYVFNNVKEPAYGSIQEEQGPSCDGAFDGWIRLYKQQEYDDFTLNIYPENPYLEIESSDQYIDIFGITNAEYSIELSLPAVDDAFNCTQLFEIDIPVNNGNSIIDSYEVSTVECVNGQLGSRVVTIEHDVYHHEILILEIVDQETGVTVPISTEWNSSIWGSSVDVSGLNPGEYCAQFNLIGSSCVQELCFEVENSPYEFTLSQPDVESSCNSEGEYSGSAEISYSLIESLEPYIWEVIDQESMEAIEAEIELLENETFLVSELPPGDFCFRMGYENMDCARQSCFTVDPPPISFSIEQSYLSPSYCDQNGEVEAWASFTYENLNEGIGFSAELFTIFGAPVPTSIAWYSDSLLVFAPEAGNYCLRVTNNQTLCSVESCFELVDWTPNPINVGAIQLAETCGDPDGVASILFEGPLSDFLIDNVEIFVDHPFAGYYSPQILEFQYNAIIVGSLYGGYQDIIVKLFGCEWSFNKYMGETPGLTFEGYTADLVTVTDESFILDIDVQSSGEQFFLSYDGVTHYLPGFVEFPLGTEPVVSFCLFGDPNCCHDVTIPLEEIAGLYGTPVGSYCPEEPGGFILSYFFSDYDMSDLEIDLTPPVADAQYEYSSGSVQIGNLPQGEYTINVTSEIDPELTFTEEFSVESTDVLTPLAIWTIDFPECHLNPTGVAKAVFSFDANAAILEGMEITINHPEFGIHEAEILSVSNNEITFTGLYGGVQLVEFNYGVCQWILSKSMLSQPGGSYDGFSYSIGEIGVELTEISVDVDANENFQMHFQEEVYDLPLNDYFPVGEETNVSFCLTNDNTCCVDEVISIPALVLIYGCLDSDACNYSPTANTDDGSCAYGVNCGDLNGDGNTNAGDLLEFLAQYGQTGFDLTADFNGDGLVNVADLLILLGYYG